MKKRKESLMPGNGKSNLIVPEPPPLDVIPPETSLVCHKFFVPMAFPVPDQLDPRKASITPKVGNFDCIGERCMLWNEGEKECWEKTAYKAQTKLAYLKENNVATGV